MIKTVKQRVILRREQTVWRDLSFSPSQSLLDISVVWVSSCGFRVERAEKCHTAKSFRGVLAPLLVYVPYEYPCISRREGGKGREMPENSGLVTRHADATRVYRLGWGSLAIIIFDRQLLPA